MRNRRAAERILLLVMTRSAFLFLLLLFAVPGFAQKTPSGIVPTFVGLLKGQDTKILTLETHDAHTLLFHYSRKTEFLDGAKKIKSADLKTGDHLAIEARRSADGSLDALIVRLAEPR
jgi:hypothetical protein